jgi:hypothetical protein
MSGVNEDEPELKTLRPMVEGALRHPESHGQVAHTIPLNSG